MFDEKLLWKERFSRTSKELSRYLRYIFNGHLVIVLVFLIGSAAYYYQEWLRTIPHSFPVAAIMAICLSFLVTYSPIYTFLSEADQIFLLPLEIKLHNYFRKSLWISYFMQIYLQLIGLAIFIPMYAAVNHSNFSTFFPFLVSMLIVKGFNILIKWHIQYESNISSNWVDAVIRYFINLIFLYLLFSNAPIYFVAAPAVILAGLYLFFKRLSKGKGLKWDLLIEQDEKMMASFYRLANLFTDVPKLKNKVKRREWLDPFLSHIPFSKDASFDYLYVRIFFRSGDYLGLVIRLTVIGGVAIYSLPNGIGQILFTILFLYLTGFQLIPLWNHYQYHSVLELYPLRELYKRKSFLLILRNLLWIQSALLSIVILVKGDLMFSCLSLLAGFVFSSYFVFIYVKGKIKSR